VNPSAASGRAALTILVPVTERAHARVEVLPALRALAASSGPGAEILVLFDGHLRAEWAAFGGAAAGMADVRAIRLYQSMGEAVVLAVGAREARADLLVVLPPFAHVEPEGALLLVDAVRTGGLDYAHGARTSPAGGPLHGFWNRLFNRMVSRAIRDEIPELGCRAHAMRQEVARALPLFGDMHRFLPVLAREQGFRCAEVAVPTSPAARRVSFDPPAAFLARLFDYFTVLFLVQSARSPLRFFGLLGALPLAAGSAISAALAWDRLVRGNAIASRPLLLLGLLLVTAGILAISVGFLGELMIYLHHRGARRYRLEEVEEAAGPQAFRSEESEPARFR
jgi:hypothetical protein